MHTSGSKKQTFQMYLNEHFSLLCEVTCSSYNELFLKENLKIHFMLYKTLEIPML